mgnify:CR=1 FL=1
MFIIDDEGTIRLDYSKVKGVHKYGLIMKDGSEIILPKIKIRDYNSWERDIEGNIIR